MSPAQSPLRIAALLLLLLLSARAEAAERLAVLELQGEGAPAEVMSQLSDQLRSGALEISRLTDPPLEIMTRESMAVFLEDMGIDPACVEGQCEVETARNLQADWVISGELTQVEAQLMLSLKLHEVSTGLLQATETAYAEGILALMQQAGELSEQLLRGGLRLPASAPPEPEPEPEPEETEQLGFSSSQPAPESRSAELQSPESLSSSRPAPLRFYPGCEQDAVWLLGVCREGDFYGLLHYGFFFWSRIPGDVSLGQVTLFNQAGGHLYGLQAGLINLAGSAEGLQIGVWNLAEESLRGVQYGLVNQAGSVRGGQLGLYNEASSLYGVQLGLINKLGTESPRYIPFLNAGF